MRTATLAAALLVSLAACGGDGGLSLTEPNQIDFAECSPVASDMAGRWIVDEWGCIGRASPTGAMNCDPALLPWVDGEEIVMVAAGPDSFTLTIAGESALAQPSGEGTVSAELSAGGVGVTTCANGSALIGFHAKPPSTDAFGAYARR